VWSRRKNVAAPGLFFMNVAPAKKQQTQIQRAVTSSNAAQDNGNIKHFRKRQSLILPSMPEDVLLLLTTRIKKMSVWKIAFVSEHLNTDQSQLTKCFSLVAVFDCCSLAIPANSAAWENHAKSAKHMSIASLMCSF